VSHSVNEILQLAHRVAFLQAGQLKTIGSISEVFGSLDIHKNVGRRSVGAVIDAEVAEHEPSYGLTRLAFAGGTLYVPLQALDVGEPLRVHVLSTDVTLLRCPSALATSALNMLDARVVEVKEADQATVDIRLDVGCPLVASVTRKSLSNMDIRPGQRLCAHIKAVALVEELTD
jgi:molybdate transport system ATP-binding protein